MFVKKLLYLLSSLVSYLFSSGQTNCCDLCKYLTYWCYRRISRPEAWQFR